ncbi:MAG: rane protein [Humibacillus sp.]|nr:rane protein [Humibacillus sp.]
MRTYRELFSLREFRVLFVTTCLTVGSGSVASLALGTLTFAATGSPVLTALAMFGAPLMRIVGQSLFGSGSDLVRPRTALLVVGATTTVTYLLQAVPGLAWWWRLALIAVGPLVTSALGGSMMALVSDIVPPGGFVLGRATINIAVGGMQIVGYGVAGLLLLSFTTTELFLGAAAALLVGLVLLRLGLSDHPPREVGASLLRRSREVNRALLGSRVVRPVYLTLWLPNGLIVGCEALFVPYAGDQAGYLFAVTAAGMLLGDVVVGRFVPTAVRDRLIGPLRFLLAVPYLGFLLVPSLPYAALLGFVASAGYAASLPLQERLLAHTDPGMRGHVFGLQSTGLMTGQAVGALLGGATATLLGVGQTAAADAIGVMAAASVVVSVLLVPGLRRSRLAEPSEPSSGRTV